MRAALFLSLLLAAFPLQAQYITQSWTQTLWMDLNVNEAPVAAIAPDGSVYCAGAGDESIWCTALDSTGSIAWIQTPTYTDFEFPEYNVRLVLANEDGLLLAWNGTLWEWGSMEMYVSAFDADGTVHPEVYLAESGTARAGCYSNGTFKILRYNNGNTSLFNLNSLGYIIGFTTLSRETYPGKHLTAFANGNRPTITSIALLGSQLGVLNEQGTVIARPPIPHHLNFKRIYQASENSVYLVTDEYGGGLAKFSGGSEYEWTRPIAFTDPLSQAVTYMAGNGFVVASQEGGEVRFTCYNLEGIEVGQEVFDFEGALVTLVAGQNQDLVCVANERWIGSQHLWRYHVGEFPQNGPGR